jgi:hypothetical protein
LLKVTEAKVVECIFMIENWVYALEKEVRLFAKFKE